MKVCNLCKVNQELSNFQKDSSKADGYRRQCKSCISAKRKVIRDTWNFKVTVLSKKCSKCQLEKDSKLFDKSKQHPDGLYLYCKECRVGMSRSYYLKTSETKKKKASEYYRNNKPKVRLTRRKYQARKEKEDILYKLARRLRARLYHALKQTYWKKGYHFNDYIGCSLPELREHIEKQFQSGMTWDNYGPNGWHIDHIKPLSKAKTVEEIHKLCHHSNLQPLWAIDNIKKGNK